MKISPMVLIWIYLPTYILLVCSLGLPFNHIEGHELYHHYMLIADMIAGVIAYVAMAIFSYGWLLTKDARSCNELGHEPSFTDIVNFYKRKDYIGAGRLARFAGAIWPILFAGIGVYYVGKLLYHLSKYATHIPFHLLNTNRLTYYGYLAAGGKVVVENKAKPTRQRVQTEVHKMEDTVITSQRTIEEEAMEEAEALCPTLKVM